MMKKLITLLLVLSMVLTSFVGCGSEDEVSNDNVGGSTEVASDIFNKEGYPIVNEEYTIKIVQLLPDSRNLKAPDEITADRKSVV